MGGNCGEGLDAVDWKHRFAGGIGGDIGDVRGADAGIVKNSGGFLGERFLSSVAVGGQSEVGDAGPVDRIVRGFVHLFLVV